LATRGEIALGVGGMVVTLAVGYMGAAAVAHAWPFDSEDPVSISFESPSEGATVDEIADYTGRVENIQRGQLVWMFVRQDSSTDGSADLSGDILATTGPCLVADETWTCSGIGVGGPGPEAAGQYTVWVSVVDEKQAFTLVDSLRHAGGDLGVAKQPPSIGSAVDTRVFNR
jgi:hypothetical protein